MKPTWQNLAPRPRESPAAAAGAKPASAPPPRASSLLHAVAFPTPSKENRKRVTTPNTNTDEDRIEYNII